MVNPVNSISGASFQPVQQAIPPKQELYFPACPKAIIELPSIPKIVQLGTISLDHNDIFQVHLEFDESTQTIIANSVCNYGLTQEFEKLQCLFQENLEIVSSNPRNIQIKLNGTILFVYDYQVKTRSIQKVYGDPLTSLELRLLNQLGKEGQITPRPLLLPKAMPADLHTHFGGAVSGKLMMETIRQSKTPVLYPVKYLKEMGVVFAGKIDEKGNIDLSHPETQIAWRDFSRSMAMNPLRICSFQEMEKVYEWRGPILKNVALLPAFLEGIAKDYNQYGVQYIELSLSDIVKTEWMQCVLECIPEIEKKYNIRVRFLVSIWRHGPKRYMEDMLALTKAYLGNPRIAGVDFMGHETTSTRDFIWALDILKEYKKIRPDLEIRVHATETSCHPDNALLAIKHGATRVGHVLHGINEELFRLASENDVIFEVQSGSNICLNSAHNLHVIPINSHLKHGRRVTIGSDGFRLYGSTPQLEVYQATQIGVDQNGLDQIRQSDLRYIAKKEEAFQLLLAKAAKADLLPVLPTPNCNSADWSLEELNRVKARKEISERLLNTLNLKTIDSQQVNALFEKKVPFLFAGATSISWKIVPEEDQRLIRKQLTQLFHHLHPDHVAIITGGTDFGLEKIVHEVVLEEKQKGRHFTLLGTLATDLQAEFSSISTALTHAVIVNNTWYDIAPFILQKVADHQGIAYFATGGDVVKNMIQISRNLGVQHFVMEDVPRATISAGEMVSGRMFSKHDSMEMILHKSLRSALLHSVTMKKEEAYQYFGKLNKKVVTFLGYSTQYENPEQLQQILEEKLSSFNPKTTIIAAGATEEGIGAIYPIAKRLNFQTLGIVSTLAHQRRVSQHVDFVIYIEDNQWGGYLPNSIQLSPVSEIIVRCSHVAIMCGGGPVAKAEADGMRRLEKDVLYLPMKNHL